MKFENPVRAEAVRQPEHVEDREIQEANDSENKPQKLLGGFPAPLSAEEALQDTQHGVNNGKWRGYWRAKLLEEAEVPATIQRIIHQEFLNDENAEILHDYVQERCRALRYWLAQQKVMKKLHEELGRIDKHEDVADPEAEHVRAVSYDETTGKMFATSSLGNRIEVTVGDVAADRVWGLTYRPDDSVPEHLWRRVRKLPAIRGARLEAEDLYNRQIAEYEGLFLPTSSWSLEDIAKEPQNGVVAERMVQTLLSRLQYDQPELGVKIEASDAFEDAQLKYDFKVTFPQHRRGVAIADPPETSRETYVETKKRLGIQFTVNTLPEVVQHKSKQVRRANSEMRAGYGKEYIAHPVDDIVLVAVSMRECSNAFKRWQNAGQPPGGPEQFLKADDRVTLVQAMLRNRVKLEDETVRDLVTREKTQAK